jgi:hypothetical protein
MTIINGLGIVDLGAIPELSGVGYLLAFMGAFATDSFEMTICWHVAAYEQLPASHERINNI